MKKRIEKILEGIPGKLENKGTISLRFKREICEWAILNEEFCKNKTAIELGTAFGWTTRVLSELFKKVITFEHSLERVETARQFNISRDNIEYRLQDIYNSEWWDINEDVGLVFIDANHSYEYVKKDFENSLKLPHKDRLFIVFDDYGGFPGVKKVVDENISEGVLNKERFLGQTKGFEYVPGTFEEGMFRIFEYKPGKKIEGYEGIICSISGENCV